MRAWCTASRFSTVRRSLASLLSAFFCPIDDEHLDRRLLRVELQPQGVSASPKTRFGATATRSLGACLAGLIVSVIVKSKRPLKPGLVDTGRLMVGSPDRRSARSSMVVL